MNFIRRPALGIWSAFILVCILVISHAKIDTDLSAFLPRSPTPAQQVLVDQLRSGAASRLILIAIEGAPPETLAQVNFELAAQLRRYPEFASVNNGEETGVKADRDFLWRNRYALSPVLRLQRFSAQGLHAAMEKDIQMLESPASILFQPLLPHDPTGELLHIVSQWHAQTPAVERGVWFSKDGKRSLLVAQTAAAGSDLDAQERALALIKDAFENALVRVGSIKGFITPTLIMSGPAAFSVKARHTIKTDAWRFSMIAGGLVATLLLVLYRSPRVLVLGLLPVASGALAGMSAVSLGFGSIHGVTLGFGTTLIGEGVDYAIYFFTQTTGDVPAEAALNRIWPTLRLGVVTSICGFSAMLLSKFPGLAQLGLFSIVGLIVAVMVTRYVLPLLLPAGFSVPAATTMSPVLEVVTQRARLLRYPLIVGVIGAALFLSLRSGSLWNDDLTSLSPISQDAQRRDQELRQDLGAPDVRYMILVNADNQENALEGSERLTLILTRLVQQGVLTSYDSPAFYLPSLASQRERKAALPDARSLRVHLDEATRGLPFRAGLFEPFRRDVETAREQPFLDIQSLNGTHFAAKVDSLLMEEKKGWAAILPLSGVTDASAIARTVGSITAEKASLVDLKQVSNQLYQTYRKEALKHSIMGLAAIVLFLFMALRSPHRVCNVLAPLVAAVVVVTVLLILAVGKLSIFHLIGLLLVVAVGSNYSLFFDRPTPSVSDRERTLASVLFANISTVIAFGILSFSKVPVLNAIGLTVGMGTMLTLICSTILIGPRAFQASATD